jgi:MFS family permease
MMLAILAYSIVTGLSAFAWDWMSFALLRFLVGVAIGSEWVTGASIVSELWPDRARGRGVGLMQCGLGFGFFLASLIWAYVGGMGPNAWRYMFLLGVLPALLTLWVRKAMPESAVWERVNDHRRAAVEHKRSGAVLQEQELALARFTLVDLFHEPEVRRRTIIAFLMSLALTFGFWGISTWVPPYIASVAANAGLPGPQWAGFGGMAYNAGALGGYIVFGFLADIWGRRPTTTLYFVGAFAFVPVLFLWAQDLTPLLVAAAALGWFATGQYTWMAAWLPELFPTRIRATGGIRVQRAPLYRLGWAADLGNADRDLRRLQSSRHRNRCRLRSRSCGSVVPAGDERQTIAGVRMSSRCSWTVASAAMGQNEPCHSLRRHGRSTSATGPAGRRPAHPGAISNVSASPSIAAEFVCRSGPVVSKRDCTGGTGD